MNKIVKLCLSPILVLNKLYKRTNHYRNQFVDIEKFVSTQAFTSSIPHNLDVINLGSNHPKFALDYSETGIKGANLAVVQRHLSMT